MKRKIVNIDPERCNGCGLCTKVCHEGALQMIGGKVVLVSDSSCDGLGDCLPECPVGAIKIIERESTPCDETVPAPAPASELTTWPVQIKLVPVNAPALANAALLVAADCTAFAHADLHRRFMRNKVTLIGCPKLDNVDYSEKLGAILAANDIESVTVLRMEVPCCGGIAAAVKTALQKSGKQIPWQVVTIATDGSVLDD